MTELLPEFSSSEYLTDPKLSRLRGIPHDLTPAEANRMAALMAQYQDTPMDLADASLVVVAESRTLRRVFTTDSDFYVYRLADGSALEVVP
jgi:hypothetical protein